MPYEKNTMGGYSQVNVDNFVGKAKESSEEESLSLISEEPGFCYNEHQNRRKPYLWLLVVNVTIFSLSCVLLFITFRQRGHDTSNLLQSISYSSVVTETFDPTWYDQQFVTEPLHSDGAILRRPPSDEVDAEWERIADLGVLTISEAEVLALGKDPANVVQAPESWGRGSDMYLANVNGIHLLHCLNSMRRSLFFNFKRYYPHGIPQAYQSHLHHCQEAIAKRLMCQPSVDLITFNWAEEQKKPFPDFDINQKCIDFQALKDWQDENRVTSMNQEMWNDLRKPADVTPIPVPMLLTDIANYTQWAEEQTMTTKE